VKNFLYIILFIVLLLAGSITVLPYFYNLNEYRDDFSKVLSEKTGLDVHISGNIEISTFPIPSITIYNINVPNAEGAKNARFLYIKSLQLNLETVEALKGNLKFKNFIFSSPTLSYEVLDDGRKNVDVLLGDRDIFSNSSDITLPESIIIKGGFLNISQPNSSTTIDYVDAELSADTIAGPFELAGTFEKGDHKISFSGNLGDITKDTEGEFNISAENAASLDISGKYISGKDFSFLGDVTGDITNMTNFFDVALDVGTGITSEETGKITGEFSATPKGFAFNNINLDSKSIKGQATIDAMYIRKGKKHSINWEYDIVFNSINLDSLTAKKQRSKDEEYYEEYYPQEPLFSLNKLDFYIPKDLAALFLLEVKELTFHKQKVNNILVDVDIFNGKLIINDFVASMPGDSKVELMGDIAHNGIRPHFTGIFRLSGKSFRTTLVWLVPEMASIPEEKFTQYLIKTKLDITPQKAYINDFYAASDRTLLQGHADINLNEKLPSIKTEISLEKLNLDEYNLTSEINKLAAYLLNDVDDTEVEDYWFDNFKYKATIDLTATNLVYNKQPIHKAATSLFIYPGIFNVRKAQLISDNTYIAGTMQLNLHSSKPSLNLNLSSQAIDLSLFIPNEEKTEKKKETAKNALFWSKKQFNFLGLKNFRGNIKADAKLIKWKDDIWRNFNFDGSIDRQVLTINQASITPKQGNITAQGKIGVGGNPSVALSVGASKLNVPYLTKLMHITQPISTGDLYFKSKFSSSGKNFFEWVKNQRTQIAYTITGLTTEGFNLQDIVVKAPRLYSAIDMNALIKKAASEGKTYFPIVKGTLQAKGRLLQTKDTAVKMKYAAGLFAGNMDLYTFKSNNLLKLSMKPKPNKVVSISYALEGDINDFKVTPNVSQLESYITSKNLN
jgi:hypothetical protein